MSNKPRARRLWRRRTHRVWSIKTVTTVAIIVVALTATSVYLFGKRSLFVETELTLALIAAALFAFLAIGLYRGIRLRRSDLPGTEFDAKAAERIADSLDPFGNSLEAGNGADDPLSAIAAIILAFVVLVVLSFLLWALLVLGVVVWVFLIAALAWIFYRALRQVFHKSRRCRGRLGPSLGYALYFTLMYTGWLFALVWIAHGLFGQRLRGS